MLGKKVLRVDRIVGTKGGGGHRGGGEDEGGKREGFRSYGRERGLTFRRSGGESDRDVLSLGRKWALTRKARVFGER